MQRHTAFLGRPVPVRDQDGVPQDRASPRRTCAASRFVGWSTVSVLVEHCRRLVGHDERFVYAYYPGVDTVAHEFGLHDDVLPRRARVRGRARRSPARRAAVARDARRHRRPRPGARRVTAGSRSTRCARWSKYCAGDGRFRYLYASKGAAPSCSKRPADEFGDQAWVFSRDQLLDEGWLGPGTGHRVHPPPGRRRDPGAARTRWRSSTRTCRTRPT